MYIINTIPHGKCFVRYLRTRCFCIRNLTSSLRPLFRFLIRQQLERKHRTPALSMKYSLCTVSVKESEICEDDSLIILFYWSGKTVCRKRRLNSFSEPISVAAKPIYFGPSVTKFSRDLSHSPTKIKKLKSLLKGYSGLFSRSKKLYPFKRRQKNAKTLHQRSNPVRCETYPHALSM